MRKLWLWGVVVSTLLGAPAWAKAKGKGKPKPDVVALRFGWPADLSANVTYRWTRSKTGKPPQAISIAGRLVVAAQGKTLRVVYRDWKNEVVGGPSAGGSLPSVEKMATIVDNKGTFLRVDGTVSADDSLRMAAAAQGGTDRGAEVRKKVADVIPELSQQGAAKTWDMLVGTWAGVEMEIGEELATSDEGPVPLVPGAKLKTNLRIKAERFLDCPGRPGKRCVELKLRSEPDRESLAKVVESLGAKFGTKGLGSAGGDISSVEEFTLVTEPDRLIPHRLDITKTVGTGGTAPDGTPRSQQVDKTTWTYDYASPSSAPGPR